jgi:PAS domain S-box-containing protein
MSPRPTAAALPDLSVGTAHAYLGMLENAPFGIIIVDKDLKLALISKGAHKVLSAKPDALGCDLEEVLRAAWPEPFVSEALGHFRRTLATGESYHAPSTVGPRAGNGDTEAYDWKLDRVLLRDGEPGVICYFHDLTEREHVQQQLRDAEVNKSFLLGLSDALRPLADPAQLESAACALLARHLDVDRVYFVWVDEAAGTARIVQDHVREGAISVKGDHRTSDFQWSIGVMRDGTCHVVSDSQDAATVPAKDRAAYAALDIRSFIGAPLIKKGALMGILCVTDHRVRTWKPGEVSLVLEVGERIWAAVEWAHAEDGLRRSHERYQAFMHNSSEGIYRCELDRLMPVELSVDEMLDWAYEHGYVAECNDAMARMYGFESGMELEGARLGDVTPRTPENEAFLKAFFEAGFKLEGGISHEQHRDGHTLVIRNNLFGFVEGGHLVRVWGTQTDITERREAEQRLILSEHRFRSIFDTAAVSIWEEDFSGVHDAIARVRGQGVTDWPRYFEEHPEFVQHCLSLVRVVNVNDATVRMFEAKDREELLGALPEIFIPESMPVFVGELLTLAEGRTYYEGEAPLRTVKGNIVHVFFTMVLPPGTSTGRPVLFSLTDISSRLLTERELRESEERIRLAADTGRVGIWEWHIPTDHIIWNDILYDVQGVTKEEFGGSVKDFTELVHPEDRERVGETIRQSLESDLPYEVSFRAVRPNDGRVIWLHTNGRVLRGADGRPERLLGAVVDMTGAKEAEALLRESDRRKDEFLATLAHELRNPLAPLRNGLEVLDIASDQPDAIKEVGAMMRRQVDQMVHLVNDLLDLSRISRGVIELREQPVDLHAALHQAVETARPMVDSNQQRLQLELSPEALIVNGDPTRLAQVFGNLLDNAGKYTDKGGTITVRSYVQGDQAVVEVIDTGIGLSQDQLPRVFDMFSQVDRSYQRARGGLGIGLHIVQRLVEMQDGRVSVRSPGLEKGSTFRVELPLLPETPLDTADHQPIRASGRHLRILLADDNADAGNMLGMLLKKAGHEVTTVQSGRQVLEQGPVVEPEIIILDIGMPEMDGFEACRQVRKTAWGRKARIVALTGWGQEEDRRRSREAGFDHHLVKPVDVQGLLGVIQQ